MVVVVVAVAAVAAVAAAVLLPPPAGGCSVLGIAAASSSSNSNRITTAAAAAVRYMVVRICRTLTSTVPALAGKTCKSIEHDARKRARSMLLPKSPDLPPDLQFRGCH